jgi:hypothetical protein
VPLKQFNASSNVDTKAKAHIIINYEYLNHSMRVSIAQYTPNYNAQLKETICRV